MVWVVKVVSDGPDLKTLLPPADGGEAGDNLHDALRRLFIRGLAIEQLLSLIASIGARHTPAFERRHGIQTDRSKRGDVTESVTRP